MNDDLKFKPATLAVQALGWVDDTTGAVSSPLHPSTTFERNPDNRDPNDRAP